MKKERMNVYLEDEVARCARQNASCLGMSLSTYISMCIALSNKSINSLFDTFSHMDADKLEQMIAVLNTAGVKM